MITLLRKAPPQNIEVVSVVLTYNNGYEIRPGGDPEKPGDPIWHQIVGKGWSKWLRCTQKVGGTAVAIKLQVKEAKTDKKRDLCWAPVALLAVDIEGDGKWQTVGQPVSTAFVSDDDDTSPTPANGEKAATSAAAAPSGAAKA